MPSFLEEVVANKKKELAERKEQVPIQNICNQLAHGTHRFAKALDSNSLKIIAELKPKSPSLGQLESSEKGSASRSKRMEIYQRYASAVSVLCDQRYFGGSVKMLEEVSSSINLPTLLKDFVIDPYQIYEGRRAGAEAVLLIVKILSDRKLEDLIELTE